MTDPLVDVLTLRKRSDPQGALTVNEMDSNWTELENRVRKLFEQFYGVGVTGDGILNPTTGDITTPQMTGLLSSVSALQTAVGTSVTNAIDTLLKTVVYPIGSFYINSDIVDPATILGFGRWSLLGDAVLGAAGGSVPVGYSGAWTTVLVNAHLPDHTHGIPALSGTADLVGPHTHQVTTGGVNGLGTPTHLGGANHQEEVNGAGSSVRGTAISNGSHAHTVTTDPSNTSGSPGSSGAAFNIKPKTFGVYIYKRDS